MAPAAPTQNWTNAPVIPSGPPPCGRCDAGSLCGPCHVRLQRLADKCGSRVVLPREYRDLELFVRQIDLPEDTETAGERKGWRKTRSTADLSKPAVRALAREALRTFCCAGFGRALLTVGFCISFGSLGWRKKVTAAVDWAEASVSVLLDRIKDLGRFPDLQEYQDCEYAAHMCAHFSNENEGLRSDQKRVARWIWQHETLLGLVSKRLATVEKLGSLVRRRGHSSKVADEAKQVLRNLVVNAAHTLSKIYQMPGSGMAKATASLKRNAALRLIVDTGSTDPKDLVVIAAAEYDLGCHAMNGSHGGPPDARAANLHWFRAAELGYPGSMRNLSIRFSKGNGVPVDGARAEYWLDRHEKATADPVNQAKFGGVPNSGSLNTYEAELASQACGISIEYAKDVLYDKGLKTPSSVWIAIVDWMVARGTFKGPLCFQFGLGEQLKNVLAQRELSSSIPADLAKRITAFTVPKNVVDGRVKKLPDSFSEVCDLVGVDLSGKRRFEERAVVEVVSQALYLRDRYVILEKNLEILGGHNKLLGARELKLKKDKLFAGLHCVVCDRTAKEAGMEMLKRCTACQSRAVAYCGKECMVRDWKLAHGAEKQREVGRKVVKECEMIQQAR
ncbi:hypothetical protein DFJ74DRAFT_774416 [Hyaloraphidium curvatum]|nr:hypothetical protein DFJ74DRAFT_774416 [Hyaloraphidium curvatum]